VATLGGTIVSLETLSSSVPAGSLRVELAWFPPSSTAARIVSQDVPVTAALPADFSLALGGAPPPEALWTSDNYTSDYLEYQMLTLPRPAPGQTFAIGEVIAYEDLNGNGKLDMLDESATSAPDRIVAADARPEPAPTVGHVFYATNGYGAQTPYQAADGYGLLEGGDTDAGQAGLIWVPISTPVTMRATDDEWNMMMCTNFNPLRESNGLVRTGWRGTLSLRNAPIWTPDVVLPPSDHPLLSCSPGGTQFCIDGCPAPGGQFYVCQAYDVSADPSGITFQPYCVGLFGGDPQCYTMPATQPAGWPCTFTAGVDCAPDPQYTVCDVPDAGPPPPPQGDGGAPPPNDAGAGPG
jgi:hypothetical protein